MTESRSRDATQTDAPLFITVAICTRNRPGSLEAATNSVIPQLTTETELLIIDNGSTDDTAAVCKRLDQTHPKVRTWREERSGIAFARNAALQQAAGKYVLFFDDDELAEGGWLGTYMEFLREAPAALGAVGGASLRLDEIPAWVHHSFGQIDFGGESRQLTDKASPGAGNCAYHRARALELGGFDTTLLRAEDSDLNDRLRAAGYQVWWLPAARVRHCIPPDRYRFKAQMKIAFDEGRAASAVRRKGYGGGLKWSFYALGRALLMPFHIGCELAGALACLVVGRKALAFRLLLRIARNGGMARGWWKA